MSTEEINKKDDATTMPSSDDLKDQARRFLVGHMENVARLAGALGDKGDRKHERKRVGQEWEKIAHDKKKGASEEEAWHGHLDRMQRMAESIGDPDKALRRARHLEAAGFSTAAKFFYARAQKLGAEVPGMEKSAAMGNLEQFNEWVQKQHRYVRREPVPGGGYKYIYDDKPGAGKVSMPADVKPYKSEEMRQLGELAHQATRGLGPDVRAKASKDYDRLRAKMERAAGLGGLRRKLEQKDLPCTAEEWVTKQHKYIKRVQQPDGTYRYYYDVPAGEKPRMGAGERELARFAGPEHPSGGARELVSPHHNRPYKELREMSMVAHLGADAYVPKAKWAPNAPVKWHKYNKDVGMLEGQAKAYHNRGMKMEADYGKSEGERKLWLATALMFRDAAKNLATKRDLITVPSAEAKPSEAKPSMQPMT